MILSKNARITVITGAGFSKASGIPTFRGKNGLWKNYDPAELATPNAFARDPKLVWEWYRWRLNIVLNASPNPAHLILAREENERDIVILTQNVDDLHERAGSRNVIHLHGEIRKFFCTSCDERFVWTKELLEKTVEVATCAVCGSLCRPAVIWFSELLDNRIIQKCVNRLSKTDILIVAGTSGVVFPVADFPFKAKHLNPSVEIYEFNLDYTPISSIATQIFLGSVEKTLVEFFSS